MESSNYEWFMTQTIESMLPRFSARNLVLTMKVEARWEDYGYGDDGNTRVRDFSRYRRTFFVVIHRPSNYTKVLVGEFDKNENEVLLPCKGTVIMKQYSDHDSCWRTDGFNWVFQTFVDAWKFFDERGIEGRKIDPMFHYSIFGGSPQYWEVESIERLNPKDRWGSDYKVKLLRQIPMHEISKFMPQPEK